MFPFKLVAAVLIFLNFKSPCQSAFIKKGIANKWRIPGMYILYSVDSRLSSGTKRNIDEALNYMNSMVPGLEFVKQSTSIPFTLSFLLDNTRSFCEDESTLNELYSTSRNTTIRITETPSAVCGTRGWILHLVMHALGFHHEHQRPDRNKYVYVNYANSRLNTAEKNSLLQIIYDADSEVKGVYDLESVMHYDYKAGALHGKMTIVSMPPELYSIKSYGHATSIEYSPESVLSLRDIEVLRDMFPPRTGSSQPPLPSGVCSNNGIWFNWCLCPPGYAGRMCEEIYCNEECQNNGKCRIAQVTGLPSCQCPEGFTGNYCEIWPNSNVTCNCPWWSSCWTQVSLCNCNPYPYVDGQCSLAISEDIPTTPAVTSPTTAEITTTATSTTTKPDLQSCDISSINKPTSMTISPNYIYLRVSLLDVEYISDYSDLSSWQSALLQLFLTESLYSELQSTSNNSFQSIIATKIHSTECTVVDFIIKFNRPLDPETRAEIAFAVEDLGTLDGKSTSKTSRIGGVYYIVNSDHVTIVETNCSVFDAEQICKNGGSCVVHPDNGPTCECAENFLGKYCDGSRFPSTTLSFADDNHWSTAYIVIACLGSVIALILFGLVISLWCWQNNQPDSDRRHKRRYPYLDQYYAKRPKMTSAGIKRFQPPEKRFKAWQKSRLHPKNAAISRIKPMKNVAINSRREVIRY